MEVEQTLLEYEWEREVFEQEMEEQEKKNKTNKLGREE